MIRGHDLLGAGNYKNAPEITKALPSSCAIGVFDNVWPSSFADPMPNVRTWLSSNRVVALRVQIWWSYQHKGCPQPILEAALPRWERLAKEFAGACKIYISPSCEYDNSVSRKQVEAWVGAIERIAPNCIPVLTPMNGPILTDVIKEVHGIHAKAKVGELASYDGGGSKGAGFDEEIAADVWMKNNERADICFCWSPLYNCAESKNTLPPNQRTASPSGKYIKAMNRLMLPKGEPPKGKQLEAPNLYKLFGEDQAGPNTRDNRPLAIVRSTWKQAFIETINGERIATLGLYGRNGDFPGKMSRFYSGWKGGTGEWGYEIAQKALKLSGTEWCWLRYAERGVRLIHPAFRGPWYQK